MEHSYYIHGSDHSSPWFHKLLHIVILRSSTVDTSVMVHNDPWRTMVIQESIGSFRLYKISRLNMVACGHGLNHSTTVSESCLPWFHKLLHIVILRSSTVDTSVMVHNDPWRTMVIQESIGSFRLYKISRLNMVACGHGLNHSTTVSESCLPYKFYVLGQIGLSKQCRPRSDCF